MGQVKIAFGQVDLWSGQVQKKHINVEPWVE